MKGIKRIYLLSFVFLLSLGLAVYSESGSETESFAGEEVDVSVDPAAISVLRFQNQKDQQATIRVGENSQLVLNDSIQIREYLQNLLYAGLDRLEVKRPVSEQSRSRVMNLLQNQGIEISIIKTDGEREEFLLAENETDPNSTYYLEKGSNEPYIVHVPGFEGSISNVFRLQPHEWKDRVFYQGNSQTLQSVKINFPDQPSDSYTLVHSDRGFVIEGFPEADTAKVHSYAAAYQVLPVKEYYPPEQEDSIRKEITERNPVAELNIEDIHGDKSLAIYRDPGAERLYGITGTGEVVRLEPKYYSPLMLGRDFFKDEGQSARPRQPGQQYQRQNPFPGM